MPLSLEEYGEYSEDPEAFVHEESVAREALRLASHKLPVATRFVKREDWT